jgi:hypothetical protein
VRGVIGLFGVFVFEMLAFSPLRSPLWKLGSVFRQPMNMSYECLKMGACKQQAEPLRTTEISSVLLRAHG